MERWDLYDFRRVKLDRQAERGRPLQSGEYHIVIHVCVFDSRGRLLIQQRQPFKEGWPNRWDVTVGGSALAGETSQQAAGRELAEEIGLAHDFETVMPTFTMNFPTGFDDFYLIEEDVDLGTLKLQDEEVQDVQWATLEEVLALVAEDRFIPYTPGFICMVFDHHRYSGILSHHRRDTPR